MSLLQLTVRIYGAIIWLVLNLATLTWTIYLFLWLEYILLMRRVRRIIRHSLRVTRLRLLNQWYPLHLRWRRWQLMLGSCYHLIVIKLHVIMLLISPNAATSITLDWMRRWSIRGMMGDIQVHTYLLSIVWPTWILLLFTYITLLLLRRATSIRWFVLVWIIRIHRQGLKLNEILWHPIFGRRTHLILGHNLLGLENGSLN